MENSRQNPGLLPRPWMVQNYNIKDNPIMDANPEVGEECIWQHKRNGQAFKRGVQQNPMGQEIVGLIGKFMASVLENCGKINVAKSELL